MRFTNYSEYVNIVESTNGIFDYWFFNRVDLSRNPVIFSTKKDINNLPIKDQTEKILFLLNEHDATEEIIRLFQERKTIEEELFGKSNRNNLKLKSKIDKLRKECDQTTSTLRL